MLLVLAPSVHRYDDGPGRSVQLWPATVDRTFAMGNALNSTVSGPYVTGEKRHPLRTACRRLSEGDRYRKADMDNASNTTTSGNSLLIGIGLGAFATIGLLV